MIVIKTSLIYGLSFIILTIAVVICSVFITETIRSLRKK